MKQVKGPYWLVRTLCLICVLAVGFATTIATTSSDDDDDFSQTILNGKFLDTAVAGLGYESGADSGLTNGLGEFDYLKGKTIRFYLGGIQLGGWANVGPILTPMDLIGGALDYTDEEVTNILRFLQTIDSDQDLSNGIQITAQMRANAANLTLDFTEPNFSANAQAIIDQIMAPAAAGTYTLIDAATAQKHFRETLSDLSNVVLTRDDLGVPIINGPPGASLYDMFTKLGYAVAQDRLWQIETFRRTANGQLAELFGPGYVEDDLLMLTTGYTDEEIQAAFDAMDDKYKSIIKGYVNGINTHIDEIMDDPSLLPVEFAGTSCPLTYWDELDILAWGATMQRNFDPEGRGLTGQIDNMSLWAELETNYGTLQGWGMFEDLRWVNDPDALTYIPAPVVPAASTKSAPESPGYMDMDPDAAAALAQSMRERQENNIENLKAINAYVKMGSYAWVVDGTKTESGNPIIYSGPQMGFSVPSIIGEASMKGAGLNVSGMYVPGIPGIVIGRTPHHAWSMQVGHAHTLDYYWDSACDIVMSRTVTINVAGDCPHEYTLYRTEHGPIVNPMPFDPATYSFDGTNPILSTKYSHWGYELNLVEPVYQVDTATSMDEFGAGIENMALSQHFCYADKDGNIAYWMSGRNPVRPAGEWRFPQGAAAPQLEWDAAVLQARSTDRNTDQHYYCGWNNKSNIDYDNTYNNFGYFFGPFHRAHVVDEYLAANDDLTFEEVRDLALNIAATYSFGGGGNPWAFVDDEFTAAVNAYNAITPTQAFTDALTLLQNWDGHFVDGGESFWAEGEDRADAWILMDAWTREVVRLTFEDEFSAAIYDAQNTQLLFNVILHSFPGSAIQNNYDWFQNADPSAPQTFDDIVVAALDNVLDDLGAQPWGVGERGVIEYWHPVLGVKVWETPFSARSTYAHCVEYGPSGPVRVESMFPLGPSGFIDTSQNFDPYYFSLTPYYDVFSPRDFPVPQ
ncbi:penicillin amidase [Desulfatibacillum alkenivorans DSM 16219]|jgi:penicillin amidase|uniref:Penicillin amidase n=1 Tax=Desulfatibacillum alkenivorans DSM 16219 TaxID=1121393 RepID=A0A1M6BY79_9BACT|nr:penicillin acylase family protein [Desulfatibacillum alkenivorans]SHI53418.1 penicillin amidase [Desulfatibacillum alkenivorans DSM 16219]